MEEALAAVTTARRLQQGATADPELPEELLQMRADAVQETARTLLHEISPVIGRARQAAEHELDQSSALRRDLDALHGACQAMRRLADATSVPEFAEINLAEHIEQVIRAENGVSDDRVRAFGRAPFMATTDVGLLTLAFENVMRNAVEATERAGIPNGAVVVTWGTDDTGHWIAIIDRGPGLPEDMDVFELGQSSKPAPSGFGLTTAREAMRSLGGQLTLEPNSETGMTAILRLGPVQ